MKRLKGFAISWFFAPYIGSADLDFFKRIKDTDIDYDVMQVRRDARDEQVLRYTGRATLNRIEVSTDFRNPRGRVARDEFEAASLWHFDKHRSEYSFIISHSNEVPSHAVAAKIKKGNPSLPWIAYFGDLVSANPYVRHLQHYPLSDEDNETERRTLLEADKIIVNNTYQRDLMLRGMPEAVAHKMVVIPHCYDPAMYDDAEHEPNDRFVLAHLGMLYPIKRTAEPLLRAVDRLVEIYPAYREKFEVVFYGGMPSAHDISVHAFMKNRNLIRFENQIPYMTSLQVMRKADALLLIDGIFNLAEDGLDVNPFFAGKLVDYMGARRPIMAITMDKGPSADILRETGNLCADSRTDRIAYVLKRYVDRKVMVDYSAYSRYECAQVTQAMEAAIRAAI